MEIMPEENIDIICPESSKTSLYGLAHLFLVMVMDLRLDENPVPLS